ncbi:MAG: PAS domain S-box protein [Bacteroidia bacterium]|nr:PAS domain S-box protein [Bacteroidia bacterium]
MNNIPSFENLFNEFDYPILIVDNKANFVFINQTFKEKYIFLSDQRNFFQSFVKNGIDFNKWISSDQKEIKLNVNNTEFIVKKNNINLNGSTFYRIELIIPELKYNKNKNLAEITTLLSKLTPDNEFFYIYTYLPVPKYRYVSANVEKIIGYDVNEFYDNPFILNSKNVIKDSDFIKHEEKMLNSSEEIHERNILTYCIYDKYNNVKWLQDTFVLIGKESRTVFGFVRDITDIKTTQNTYSNLLENIPVPYIVVNQDGIIIYGNKFFFDLMKVQNPEEFLNEKNSYKNYLLEEYFEVASKRVNKIFKERQPTDFIVYEIRNALGEIVKVQVRSIPILYNNEPCMLTTMLDLSVLEKYHEQKIKSELLEKHKTELEEKIKEISELNKMLAIQKNRFDVLMSQSEFLIWIIDKNYEFKYFNDNFIDKFLNNYSSWPEIGKTGADCINDEKLKKVYRDFWYKHYELAFKGEKVELEKVDKERGTENPIVRIINLYPLYNGNGEVIEVAGVARDISEKVISKKLLAMQSAQIKSIIDNGPHYYWSINKKQELTSFNRNYEKLHFSIYKQKPVLYSKFNRSKLNQNNGVLDIVEKYERAFEGIQQGFDVKLVHDNGFEQFLSVYMMPVYSEEGEITEISVMAFDITDKVSVLQELKNNEQKLNISLKEKEILLKELHHRVKNNLQVISSILNIQTRFLQDHKAKAVIEETKNRIKSMSLVHENLYKSKEYNYLNLNSYLRDIFNNIINGFIENGNQIELEFHADNCMTSTETAIPLGLIFNELMTNAVKHGLNRSKNKKFLKVVFSNNKNLLTLSVTDSGPGFKENYFENPEKINSLGMILIRDLCYQIGAKIELKNIPGNCSVCVNFTNKNEYVGH